MGKKIYVAYFLGGNDIALIDYVGWSQSEYAARQFLRQFTVDRDVYEEYILEKDEEESAIELDAIGVDIEYDTKITNFETHAGSKVLITPRIYMTWLEIVADPEGPIKRAFTKDNEEDAMYNRLFAYADRGIIKDKRMVKAIKNLVLEMYKKYKVDKLNPPLDEYGNIDHVEVMIREQYMIPFYVERGRWFDS